MLIKNNKKLGDESEKIIKNHMRVNDLSIATFGNYEIVRTKSKSGDRFKFKERKI